MTTAQPMARMFRIEGEIFFEAPSAINLPEWAYQYPLGEDQPVIHAAACFDFILDGPGEACAQPYIETLRSLDAEDLMLAISVVARSSGGDGYWFMLLEQLDTAKRAMQVDWDHLPLKECRHEILCGWKTSLGYLNHPLENVGNQEIVDALNQLWETLDALTWPMGQELRMKGAGNA